VGAKTAPTASDLQVRARGTSFGTPHVQALVQGVQDDDYLVRRHSAQTLLTLAGRHATIEKVPDLWAEIRDSDPMAWHRACPALGKVIGADVDSRSGLPDECRDYRAEFFPRVFLEEVACSR
jgi:hypothetical protein